MRSAITKDTAFGDAPDDYDERFTIRDPRDIRDVLIGIRDSGQSITAYLENGQDFALTTLLALPTDPDCLILEKGPDTAAFKRLLRAGKTLLVASHRQVKVKCFVEDARQIDYDGQAAARASFPAWLTRVQRREYFRIAVSITRPLICSIPLPRAQGGIEAEAVVLDLSVGGVALMNTHGSLYFRVGDRFKASRLHLPGGDVIADIEVQSAYVTPLKNGSSFRRCGCRFVNLSPSAETLIQRTLLRLEKNSLARR